ncbi:class I SAM-dependent methyltransferase [Pseudomonas sp. GD03860]|uniref:class I SAM-dependent methyltransferase n=1 Tax=Pseudomonas TaxID=286 RepID=UPI002364A555|nr:MULTISPECIES: class I SAM-dependent methyltransferase [Pseudomonas]MDD2061250.1 class I SAM-dependent methyltransferase [Pseudomonas putida]MDH0639103.1 class I SAM-dependent methyltransferase [Pseudomonas sp. GD03860]
MDITRTGRSANWRVYYEHHEGRPASALLRAALPRIGTDVVGRQAVDLGCGAGNDSRFLLENGWHVLAIDREESAINRVTAMGEGFPQGQLHAVVQAFENLVPLPACSLVFAGMALPFCHPEHFAALWKNVLSALEPGAVFAGNLFGDRDSWAGRPFMSFQTQAQARTLFEGLELEFFHEHEEDGPCMQGFKHWHRFDFIAKKPMSGGAR